jgi:hypothetical protein
MKTIELPQGHVATEPAEELPSFAEHLLPFEVCCTNPLCGAKLLVDAAPDLAYRALYTMYADEMRFTLVATCPHCDVLLVVEEYSAPGNPVGQALNPTWRSEIPLQLRSKAYKQWESDPNKNRTYWKMFFGSDAVRGWSRANQRAARKMRRRLCPDYTLDMLKAAGFTDVELRKLDRTVFPNVVRFLERTDLSFAEVVVEFRTTYAPPTRRRST